jgi:peptidoglycan/xylan/chitin deacetylase (PgdA/CDA1 family)
MRKLYRSLKDKMPNNIQGHMSRMVFALSGKPFVKKDDIPIQQKFPGSCTGAMVISADFELAWAWRFAKRSNDPWKLAIIKARRARENFPVLMDLCNTYNIPITWATVGAMFLKNAKKDVFENMTPIPHFENANWRFDSGNWYDNIPCTQWENAKEWYAPDLIEQLLDSPVNHEIGNHTFSHIDFTDKNCPPIVADEEMAASIDAAKPYGIDFTSFVYPGGTLGNYDTIKKHGIITFRKSTDFDLAFPYRDENGLIITTRSEGFEGKENYNWSDNYITYRLTKAIDKAIDTGTVVHYWFHPSLDHRPLHHIMPNVFKYAAQKRDKGKLWITTMTDLAKRI